jgi:hypothetical protein
MSEEIAKRVIANVQAMAEAQEEFEDQTLQEFSVAIQYLLNERVRTEEVLALASAMLALDHYKKSLAKLIEYARIGALKEREATLLEIQDQIDKELNLAVAMQIHQYSERRDMANEIKTAILRHLEPTLGRGRWQAREEATILETISHVMEGYLVVKLGPLHKSASSSTMDSSS